LPPLLHALDGCLLVSDVQLGDLLARVGRGLQRLLLGLAYPSAGTGRLLGRGMESGRLGWTRRSCLGGGGRRGAGGEGRRVQSRTSLTLVEE